MRHLPHCHLEVHLGEFKQPVEHTRQKAFQRWTQMILYPPLPLKKSRHPDVGATPVASRPKLSAILTGDGDTRTAHRTGPDRSTERGNQRERIDGGESKRTREHHDHGMVLLPLKLRSEA